VPYRFTYEPLNRIAGVKPSTGERETASEAWLQVHGLQMSDKKVTEIIAPDGRSITWQELSELAASDAN
jgi:hypothetical protein